MTIEEKREQIAQFLEAHLAGVTKLLDKKKHGFNFKSIVTKGTVNADGHFCGTICCMQGWLPYTFPTLFEWKLFKCGRENGDWGVVSFNLNNTKITRSPLWIGLILPRRQYKIGYENLADWATFEEVSALWKTAIIDLRAGKLDEFIDFKLI